MENEPIGETPQEIVNSAKAEMAAYLKIVKILAPLPEESRKRILQSFAVLLGLRP